MNRYPALSFYEKHRRQDNWNALCDLMLFVFFMTILLLGGAAVLYILHLMEDTNIAFCLAALGVYAWIAFWAVWVALSSG